MRAALTWLGRPEFLRIYHGWNTVAWGLLVPITVFSSLKVSITWIALMSVYANFASEFSAWQSSRTEVAVAESVTAENDADAARSAPA